jgi:glycosyltransferase involved in cell wall biosynthesis
MSVLEAYACGKPVVASKVYGLKDLVVDGVTGFLAEYDDANKFAHFILSLIDDDQRSKEMGLRGREFVKENFCIENVVDRLEDLYRDVASSPRKQFR